MRKKILIPKFDSEWQGVQILSYIIGSIPGLHRGIESDVNFCRAVWNHLPRTEIWYEEFCPGFWMINYSCATHGEMGVFGND